jgi:hypothetical protein
MGTTKCFSVNGDGFAFKGVRRILDPSGEKCLKSLGFKFGEQAAEGIMGGDAVGQLQKLVKPGLLGMMSLDFL